MLDSGPLGQLAHHRPNREIREWLSLIISTGIPLIVPEIADFEVRRSLLLHKLVRSISELDRLKSSLIFHPISSDSMLKAANLWADARSSGKPTADPKELDCDVILAPQAIEAGAIVATE